MISDISADYLDPFNYAFLGSYGWGWLVCQKVYGLHDCIDNDLESVICDMPYFFSVLDMVGCLDSGLT